MPHRWQWQQPSSHASAHQAIHPKPKHTNPKTHVVTLAKGTSAVGPKYRALSTLPTCSISAYPAGSSPAPYSRRGLL
jgi:hypothetical protein